MSTTISKISMVVSVGLVVAALAQELEKPPEARRWHGLTLGRVPYDFRAPSLERLMNRVWNRYDTRILMPTLFGVGWMINFRQLLERVRLYHQDVTESGFLFPTSSMKDVLGPYYEVD